MKNTSISLGNYFDQFVSNQVSVGRYKNVSEVIRAGLRLLENEESKSIALKNSFNSKNLSASFKKFFCAKLISDKEIVNTNVKQNFFINLKSIIL